MSLSGPSEVIVVEPVEVPVEAPVPAEAGLLEPPPRPAAPEPEPAAR